VESIVFHVEYGWNGITKMAGISPKTYSMWNRWNPPGMIWIPYGFLVECGGRVKTLETTRMISVITLLGPKTNKMNNKK